MIVGNPISTGVGDAIYVLTIITAPGANVSAVLGDQTIATTANGSGVAVLRFKKEGTWTITATDGVNTKTITMEVTARRAETITFFPAEPTEYTLIETYTASQSWTAPEDGYFKIEVFGASGKGGKAYAYYRDNKYYYWGNGGGGGGGGGYACSNIKLKKGDVIAIVSGAVGSDSTATINSSLESYSKMTVTSGANGTDSSIPNDLYEGKGGAGGVASGGNVANANGGDGSDGGHGDGGRNGAGGAGGAAGYTGGNAGGVGGTMNASSGETSPGAGKAGFIKIYRGNTNVA